MLATHLCLPLFSALSLSFFGRFISKKGAIIISILCISISFAASAILLIEVVYFNSTGNLEIINTYNIYNAEVIWSFMVDRLNAMLFFLVILISLIVHLYSIEYMGSDPHFIRFISYLSFFTFFMLILLSSENIFQFFIGWEGVGLFSYLLISFWYTRTQANSSAIKAFIVNRVGDLFFLIGFSFISLLFGSFNFSVIFTSLSFVFNYNISIFFGLYLVDVLFFLSFCFFIGVLSKSAQIFLHSWLPDAMEGPTPVSALIHAATMVAAGVFLISRFSYIYTLSDSCLDIILIVGALTAFFSASIGFFQNDVKRIIAFSTCSQLGLMVFSSGLSMYSLSIFHLINHAFFKALLFLSSGSLIHSLSDIQDVRRMGSMERFCRLHT
jgi:proton-translocating NADH-quinone oxidoreductase chain L